MVANTQGRGQLPDRAHGGVLAWDLERRDLHCPVCRAEVGPDYLVCTAVRSGLRGALRLFSYCWPWPPRPPR